MKRTVIIISVVALVLALAAGTFIYINSKQLEIEFYENTEVGLNDVVYNHSFIKTLKNGKVITEKTLIDTDTVGEKTVILTVKPTFGAKRNISYSVFVVDNESPHITYSDHLETFVGTQIDLLEGVSAHDNSGEEIVVRVEGDYDINTAGEYTLKYVALDSAMNKTEVQFTLTVREREQEQEDTPTTTPAPDNTPDKSPDPDAQSTDKPQDSAVYFTTSKGFSGVIKDGVTYIDGYLIANKTYPLPKDYGDGLTGKTMSAFNSMANAAKKDGLNIYISSGFRSYNYQKNLYEKYVKRDGVKKADTYSARAGHSEHQSGLAFDVNIISDAFIGTPEAIWLADNCYKYGFILRYPENKTDETGYKYEPWHFRYVGEELAYKLYNGGDWITMESYFGISSEYRD